MVPCCFFTLFRRVDVARKGTTFFSVDYVDSNDCFEMKDGKFMKLHTTIVYALRV